MLNLLKKLWMLNRTINSDDMDKAFDLCSTFLGKNHLKIHKYSPGEEVFTWYIPERYHVKEAWLELDGERVADFKENPLYLVSYSKSKKIDDNLENIKDHIWSSVKRPNAIPWEFKYYERSWGFCVPHNILKKFNNKSRARGIIDVSFGDGPMNVGEVYVPGSTDKELLFITNICHPAQVNDSISGLVVALEFVKKLIKNAKSKFGLRLLIVPETVGSVAWFAKNKNKISKIKYAWFCEMVGHDNDFILQKSRQGDTEIDRAFLLAMKKYTDKDVRHGKFREVVASDEIVSNGPGFDIPTPSITRWPYEEYHTSDDSPKIIKEKRLREALSLIEDMWIIMNQNYTPKRKFKGPIMLSRYGLWVDWRINKELNLKTEAIMLMLEGDKSLVDIAFELNLEFDQVKDYLEIAYSKNLIEKNYEK